MSSVKRLVLDVLKPHQPNTLDFAKSIASIKTDYRVDIQVLEVDEKTETVQITIEGNNLDFDLISNAIKENGASLHSIDEVSVDGK